jgi:hypothetical protein
MGAKNIHIFLNHTIIYIYIYIYSFEYPSKNSTNLFLQAGNRRKRWNHRDATVCLIFGPSSLDDDNDDDDSDAIGLLFEILGRQLEMDGCLCVDCKMKPHRPLDPLVYSTCPLLVACGVSLDALEYPPPEECRRMNRDYRRMIITHRQ